MIRCDDSLANSFVEVCSRQRLFPIAELGVARDSPSYVSGSARTYIMIYSCGRKQPLHELEVFSSLPRLLAYSFASMTTACIHFGINTLPTLLSGICRPAATARSQSLSRIPRATAPTHPHIFEVFRAASLGPSGRSPQLVVQLLRKLP